ncbi:MAG: hypothetical protein KDA42_10895 [Planctomycetales bacterium]|nr:hypothetical protein [Planctomycetales bacterium]
MKRVLLCLLTVLACQPAIQGAEWGAATHNRGQAADTAAPRLLPRHPVLPTRLFALPPGAKRLPPVEEESERTASTNRTIRDSQVVLVGHEEAYGYGESFSNYYETATAGYDADANQSDDGVELLAAGADPEDDYGILPASRLEAIRSRRHYNQPPPTTNHRQLESSHERIDYDEPAEAVYDERFDYEPHVEYEARTEEEARRRYERDQRARQHPERDELAGSEDFRPVAHDVYSSRVRRFIDENYDEDYPEIPCDQSCDGGSCDVCYESDGLEELQGAYFRAELLLLTRERAERDQTLVVQGVGQTPIFSASDIDFDPEVGPRAVAGFNINECNAIELTYFGTHHWHAQETVSGANDLAIPGDLALATFDFLDADRMRFNYAADLHSGEGNWIYRLGCIDFFGGARFLSLDEQFNINAFDAGFGSGDYNVRVSNDLYGGQIGAAIVQEYSHWGWDGFCKAGAFSNSVDHRQTVGDFNNQIALRDVHTYDSDVAFVGEAALHLAIFLSDRVSLRGGYHVLWADGVALAPNQLDFTDTALSGRAIDMESTLFLHGATGGVEVIW